MEQPIRYRNVPVRAAILPSLQAAERQLESTEPPGGSVLFLLARATRRNRILVVGEEAWHAALWLAMACGPDGHVTYLAPAGRPALDDGLSELPVTPTTALEEGACYDMVVIVGASDGDPGQLVERLCPDGLLLCWRAGECLPALTALAASRPAWRIVEAESSFYLAGPGARAPRFVESPREALLALLLQVARPRTVVLGPNVVFDGAAKPAASKISFSGVGGQIGAGDWLIVHPDDLGRFPPLPGAVALVLGDLDAPLEAAHAGLSLQGEESERMTLVVAMASSAED